MIPWWRTVAASRALQARARELADQLTTELAMAMADTGTAEPELAAALAVTAYRTVHLQAVRCVLAGEDAATVAAGSKRTRGRRSQPTCGYEEARSAAAAHEEAVEQDRLPPAGMRPALAVIRRLSGLGAHSTGAIHPITY
jgi:hypothetical protein